MTASKRPPTTVPTLTGWLVCCTHCFCSWREVVQYGVGHYCAECGNELLDGDELRPPIN